MTKKNFLTLAAISLLFLVQARQAFCGTETDIMNKYDFSSPKASFLSLQQAIQEKDFYGTNIHFWHIYKYMNLTQGTGGQPDLSDKSMEEAIPEITGVTPDAAEFFFQNAVIRLSRLASYPGSKDHNTLIANLTFVNELACQKDENGMETCRIEVEDATDGSHGYVTAFSDDGKNWWIMTIPGD